MLGENAPLVLSVFAGISVALFFVGLFLGNGSRTSSQAVARRRMEEFAIPEDVDPLERSFAERVMRPLVATLVGALTSVLPTQVLASVEQKIEVAGRPTTASRFFAMWMTFGLGLPLMFGMLFIIAGSEIGPLHLAFVGGGMIFGLYVPWTWLRRKANQRSARIGKDLPDAIDLIITNIEAGLGMQAAFLTVSEKFGGPIGEEFARVVHEVSLGAGRTETLIAMSERTGVPEMRLFARSVAQAEQTGIPVARVLRNHSAEVREKRQQRAREQAAKIPVKITLPTVLIMFPTLFLLILGPVGINVMIRFGG